MRASTPEMIINLAKEISSGETGPFLLTSPEDYLIESAIKAITTAWLGPEPDPLQVVKMDSKEFSADYFLANVLTFGMFTERRLAILWDIDLLNTAGQEAASDAITQVPPETLLVCTTKAKKTSKNKLVKALESTGKVVDFPVLKGMDLVKWVRQAAQEMSLSLHPEVEAELLATFGGNLYQLRSELEKVATYMGTSGGKVTISDLTAIIGRSSLHSIFDLTDALGEQNLAKARHELQRLLSAGENPGYIITMLQWHLANLWQCKCAPSNDSQTLAKMLGIHPYVITKCLKQAVNFTRERLEKSYLMAIGSEFRLKTGKAPRLDVELDRLVVESIANC